MWLEFFFCSVLWLEWNQDDVRDGKTNILNFERDTGCAVVRDVIFEDSSCVACELTGLEKRKGSSLFAEQVAP